ncbi:signal peptidase II [uncultured Paracoccus sp.]|jgi:signal peptidase II|uniref:signal peptidase II n=2 Tax=Paracoccus TaxID=265 RepID=UPI0026D9FA9D|tara:strand:+ start:1790 stop:2446 length:657 start_codon:yes stop_codon:yes gene_type:complete
MQNELPFEAERPPAKPARKPRRPRKPKPPPRADMRLTGRLATVIIVLDQALKYWVLQLLNLDLLRRIDVAPPWLNLRMAWNQGMNFGLMASDRDLTRWLLIGIAVAICIWVWIWLRRSNAGLLARISGGLLIGGAIGNVIDRLRYGAVADFLNMSLPGWDNPFSFNIADISIFAGAIVLVLLPQEKKGSTGTKARKSAAAKRPGARGDKPRDGAENSR